jgi:hypothetical protein
MLRLTVDTSWVIHGVETQGQQEQVNQLVELARAGCVELWLTSAF